MVKVRQDRSNGQAARRAVANGAPASAWRRVALLARTPRRGRGFWYGVAIDALWTFAMAGIKPVWRGGEHVPETGGVLLASNHVSFVDPITETAFVLAHGRIPRYLAKASLWNIPLIGRVLAGGKHIPVRRGTRDVLAAYAGGLEALERGEAVLVYPEATFTSDPDGWPMRGKTGVARMALATGVPVVPIAHWGGQEVLPRKKLLPRLVPRRTVYTFVGPPVDLSDFADAEPTREVLATATKRIMAAITDLLADIRGETPPTREAG
ncbi:MAG TPA: lysophospholipid acyltransferase family protein [Pseudonocardiaceae bacterium]|nr:lysophospholipid acyltransferase family protein [Pseudonocardiaceae bacterium]